MQKDNIFSVQQVCSLGYQSVSNRIYMYVEYHKEIKRLQDNEVYC